MMLCLRLAFAAILVVSAMACQSLGGENPEQPSKTRCASSPIVLAMEKVASIWRGIRRAFIE